MNRLQLALYRISLGVQWQVNKRECFKAEHKESDELCNNMVRLQRRLQFEWPAVRFSVFGRESADDGNREGNYVQFLFHNLAFFENGYHNAGFRRMETDQSSISDVVRGRINALAEARAELQHASRNKAVIVDYWYLFLAASAAMRLAVFAKDLVTDVRKHNSSSTDPG